MKQLVRDVLLELMPQLRHDIADPRTGAQTKARQFADGVPAPSSQPPIPQTLAPPHANGHARITAQNP
jgi:hypothetical protein